MRLARVFAVFTLAVASPAAADCAFNPVDYCVCDSVSPTVALAPRAMLADGGFKYRVSEVRGASNGIAVGTIVPPPVNTIPEALLMRVNGGAVTESFDVDGALVTCPRGNFFEADAGVVMDAMISPTCVADLEAATGQKERPPPPCNDTWPGCGCGASGAASGMLLGTLLLLRLARRRIVAR